MQDEATAGENRIHVSWTEAGFVIGVAGVVDLIEIGLDALDGTVVLAILGAIGTVLIDIAFGYGFFVYCLARGIKLTVMQKISLGLSFLLEFFPVFDVPPWWTLDAIYIMLSAMAQSGSSLAELGMATVSAQATLKRVQRGMTSSRGTSLVGKVAGVAAKEAGYRLERKAAAKIEEHSPTAAFALTVGRQVAKNRGRGRVRALPGAVPPRLAREKAPTGAVPPRLARERAAAGSAPPVLARERTPAGSTPPIIERAGPELVGRTFEHDQELARGGAVPGTQGGVKTYEEWAREHPRAAPGAVPPVIPGWERAPAGAVPPVLDRPGPYPKAPAGAVPPRLNERRTYPRAPAGAVPPKLAAEKAPLGAVPPVIPRERAPAGAVPPTLSSWEKEWGGKPEYNERQ